MIINQVSLQNFRNLKSLDLKLDQGFIVLAGPNGAGKTNFLEGIYFGSSLRRFPESKTHQLFQEGKEFFQIKLGTTEKSWEAWCEQTGTGYGYKLKTNHQNTPRAKYTGGLPAISFLPQDLNLLTRSPGGRRRFLNETLAMTSPEYRHLHTQYTKVTRQRNDLLSKIKNGQAQISELAVWDEQLVEFGSGITRARGKLIDFLNTHFPEVIKLVSPELGEGRFIYQNSAPADPEQFFTRLEALQKKELEFGSTLLGPHRDDFRTLLGDKDVVGYVSRGQLRSITLALKILEKNYLEEQLHTPPVMLLDDVLSELDHEHQQRLIEFLKSLEQVFITTAHLEEIGELLPEQSRVYNIEAGAIKNV